MPENFIAQFVWITDGNFDNQAKIKSCHEYVLLYAKDANKFDFPDLVDPNIGDDVVFTHELVKLRSSSPTTSDLNIILYPIVFNYYI